ncbi:MAG: flagellar positioning protein PflI [Caulobacteraceae bacterium]|nr:flagellar positioning protein PflI [Caulobacter sp.]
MNPIGVGLDSLLGLLLIAALMVGARLSKRLKALRDGQAEFVKSVRELDAAALRAEAGLASLRQATQEAHDQLLDRIEAARTLSARLDRASGEAEAACARAEALARMPMAPPQRPALHLVPPCTPARTDLVLDPEPEPAPETRRPRLPDLAAPAALASPAEDDGPLARLMARRNGGRR